MTRLIQIADRALQDVKRAFREGQGSPADLEDVLALIQDAKNDLLAMTKQVRQMHDNSPTSKP